MLPNLRRNQPAMSQSKARKPRRASFQPLRYIQMDLVSLIGFPDRDKRYCWNLVDESTRYSVQDALRSKTAAACARIFVEFMIVIKSSREKGGSGAARITLIFTSPATPQG
jgi:hypothetical protein